MKPYYYVLATKQGFAPCFCVYGAVPSVHGVTPIDGFKFRKTAGEAATDLVEVHLRSSYDVYVLIDSPESAVIQMSTIEFRNGQWH